jgi:sulfite exporter TauE/SafE/copper chaperone CopZ
MAHMKQETFTVKGMACTGCEAVIEETLSALEGVHHVKANFTKNEVTVAYDPAVVGYTRLFSTLKSHGYTMGTTGAAADSLAKTRTGAGAGSREKPFAAPQFIGVAVVLVAIYLIINATVGFNFIPEVKSGMGYGVLFLVGLLTSLHCVAMCGGINLSQCVGGAPASGSDGAKAKVRPSLLYNLGRVTSYTIIGGIVGAVGSAISFTGWARGLVAVVSGLFMIIMGLSMTGLFPWINKITPRLPRVFREKTGKAGKGRGPYIVGLLNGLMPCGPLQAMQLYALGTGSFIAGALSMLFFSLGTVPLMFGLGAIVTMLGSKFTKKMMKFSAVLVAVLGIVMLGRGLALSGVSLPSFSAISTSATATKNVATVSGSVQNITTPLQSGSYAPITVQKGIPVKWTIKADANSINGCNKTLQIPQYDITVTLKPGDNVISFTPDKEGTFAYSCWMGMINSTITVVSDLSKAPAADSAAAASSVGGSAGLAGGCCGATPPAFADGKIPTDTIGIAKISGNEQEVTIDVGSQGYSPAVVVLQKDIPARIKFTASGLNGCNSTVVFPELNGQLNLSKQTETPLLPPEAIQNDFTFECGMSMLHGYVKVVDDITKVDTDAIKKDVQNYKPAGGLGGGLGGCCG